MSEEELSSPSRLTPSRRRFLGAVGAAVSTGATAAQASTGRAKAIAFDAFPILDPSPVFALGEKLFPGKGGELAAAWRTRQFEYTWLRTMSRRYESFWQVTEDALTFAAHALTLELTSEKRDRLMDAYLELRCWPDVPAALHSLKGAGFRLGFLSNMTEKMLQAGIRNSGLEGVFEFVLSTDRVQAFKPDPRAYQMAIEALGLRRDEIVFAAFAGWDAAGARTFGYPTFWVNRQNQPPEELGVSADATGKTLQDLVRYITA